MANIMYTKAKHLIASQSLNVATATLRALLVRDTSAYTPDIDHDFLDSFTGGSGVEISVASYARKTLANVAVNRDDTNNRIEIDCDDVAFGALESGQAVEAIIIYQQVGGDDTTPANDPLIAYIDTATGLPLTLNGGSVTLTVNAEGLLQLT